MQSIPLRWEIFQTDIHSPGLRWACRQRVSRHTPPPSCRSSGCGRTRPGHASRQTTNHCHKSLGSEFRWHICRTGYRCPLWDTAGDLPSLDIQCLLSVVLWEELDLVEEEAELGEQGLELEQELEQELAGLVQQELKTVG